MHRYQILLLCAVLVLGACSVSPLDEDRWRSLADRGAVEDPLRSASQSSGMVRDDDVPEPQGALSLAEALSAALRRSPDLAAFSYEVRAMEADAIQQGLLPNPEVSVEFENFAGSGQNAGIKALETTVALGQVIELGGKRSARRRVGDAAAELAMWDYEVRRLEVLGKTAGDYVALLTAYRRAEIAREVEALARRVSRAVDERVRAGKVSPLERTRASVELARAKLAREEAEREVFAARIRLASNWGSTTPRFDTLSGDLERVEPPPALDELYQRVEQSPDLRRWVQAEALRRAEIELALSGRKPDLTAGVGVRLFNESDDAALVAGLAIDLPIFDRNQGALKASRLRLLRTQQDREAAWVRARASLAQEYGALTNAYMRVKTVREEILPAAETAFEAAEVAFRQGKIGALDLFDAQRSLFDAKRQLTQALAMYHIEVIAVERLIGTTLHEGREAEGDES